MDSRRVVNLDDLKEKHTVHKNLYEWRRKKVGGHIEMEKLGASVYQIPPGKRAFLLHFHHANEELFYILEGTGIVRTFNDQFGIKAGDFISTVARKEGTHQIINNSERPLKYIAISTMLEPEIVEYPESEKLFIMAGIAPGGEKKKREISRVFRKSDAVDYWKGEPQ